MIFQYLQPLLLTNVTIEVIFLLAPDRNTEHKFSKLQEIIIDRTFLVHLYIPGEVYKMSFLKNLGKATYIAICLLTFTGASVCANSWHQNTETVDMEAQNLVAQNVNPTIAGDPNLFGVWFYVEYSHTVNGSAVYQEKMNFLPNGELHIYDPITMVNGFQRGTSGLVIDRGQWAVQDGKIYTRRSYNEPWSMISSGYSIHDGDLIAINSDGTSRRRWTRN
ncbi:MAG: hypothetical protein Tsb0014_22350 [Pleurocapsa sp.]